MLKLLFFTTILLQICSRISSAYDIDCHFWGQTNNIYCSSPKGDIECKTTLYSSPALTYTGGHTPVGLYAMGKLRYNDRVYNHPWYNLYPRKKDNSGWWDYAAYNVETYKSSIGLHRGNATTRGYGCISVPDNDCWEKLENVVNSYRSTEIITATFHDIAAPLDKEVQAEVIGRLTIHN